MMNPEFTGRNDKTALIMEDGAARGLFIFDVMYKNIGEGSGNMLEWKDVTDTFDERSRHWKGRYLEICEVAGEKIECSLFSCENDDWEIYFNYGIMYGVVYAKEGEAKRKRKNIMKDIEKEYSKNGEKPSGEFMHYFDKKYHVNIMNAFF